MRLSLRPDDLGPFPPDVGGFLDFTVTLEAFDSEGDGVDTQGVAGVVFDVLTDTGLSVPMMSAALTGETGVIGPANVTDPRHFETDELEPRFVGGYGFTSPDGMPFGGSPIEDDVLGIGHHLSWSWQADTAPNAPGLQPNSLAGVGYGERPAGGDWLFAVGEMPIPMNPGLYTVELMPSYGTFILPDIDLTVDHPGDWTGTFAPEDMLGDTFSFTVLPEPGSALFGAMSAALLMCRRRARSRG